MCTFKALFVFFDNGVRKKLFCEDYDLLLYLSNFNNSNKVVIDVL